jgi:histidyl-tRNA synthetase
MESLEALPGTYDLLPAQTREWDRLRSQVADIMGHFAYGRIETPHLEAQQLFDRSVGAETDIVQKEMYTFTDRGGRRLALRPEGTAGVVRAYIEERLDRQRSYHKLWYWGPMFRAERPQKGRYRQFWQFGVETFGVGEASMDAEQVALAWMLSETIGIAGRSLRLNSIGDAACRPAYQERLTRYLGALAPRLCPSCQKRMQTNPLRVLDCKEEECRRLLADAPLPADHLCAACQAHFAAVRRLLDHWQIPYALDGRIVRGLDYYVRTAFELDSDRLGAQSAVLGGGRYDGLVAALGGPDVAGVGWAAGVERALLAAGRTGASEPGVEIYIAGFPETRDAALALAQKLRRDGNAVEVDHLGRSLKSQLKEAARLGARWTLVLGPDEWQSGKATLRNMSLGTQEVLELERATALIASS